MADQIGRGQISDTIERMWNAGATTAEIAEEIGQPVPRVSARIAEMRRQGRHLPHRREPAAEQRRAEIRELLDQGLTQADIARRLGITPQAVAHHVRRMRANG